MTADYLVKKVEIKFAILLDICKNKFIIKKCLQLKVEHDIMSEQFLSKTIILLYIRKIQVVR